MVLSEESHLGCASASKIHATWGSSPELHRRFNTVQSLLKFGLPPMNEQEILKRDTADRGIFEGKPESSRIGGSVE